MTLYIGEETVNDFRCGGELINHLYWCNEFGQLIEVWRREMGWQEITSSSMLTAPPWAAWVDIVVLGAGGGGSGGNNSSRDGNGGLAGGWAHSTFDMIPGRDLSILVGQGGAGGSGGNAGAGTAGGPTVVSTSFNGWSVTGLGGAGGSGTGGGPGTAPAVWSAYRRTFSGGAAQPATEATGNAPGGGGGPGKGAFLSGAKAGGAGAPGRVWIRWRSY